MKFLGNIILRGIIRCETGLHIGGNKDLFEIGGIDSPVIRDPVTQYPYIPGSSLKGKMRFLLEWETGRVSQDGKPHKCDNEEKAKTCPVCRVFGISADKDFRVGPTRLIVRDAHPTQPTIEMWKGLNTGLLYTEWKKENYIDRITSKADPRDIERVPKGSEFEFEMIYSIYDMGDGGTKDVEFFKYVEITMRLLKDSALGGSGSRGYGKISFPAEKKRMIFRSREDYIENREGTPVESREKIKEIINELAGSRNAQGAS